MTDTWIAASYVHGRPVRLGEPYPHICGKKVTGRMTGNTVRLQRRDCVACASQKREPSA